MLLLVRHGRTAHNASRRLLGRLDVPLDELGERQADALAAVPAIAGARRVVTSPLLRCRATAERLGPPVSVDERWVEVDYGVHDGTPLDEVPAELWASWRDDLAFCPPGGEALAAVAARVRTACDELWAEATEADVVVVTHVSPIKAAVAWALGAPDEAVWRMFVEVASLHRIGGSGSRPVLHSFNEVAHRPSR
ncbi:MAG TPA: histidine phosphatase family protein [Acidimicrobiales bacterium]|nr:histidine phosphatase family protein [Acidimicrobiales bacterium]